MVNASKMLFSIPGSENKWTDNLNEIRCAQDSIISVKEVVGTPARYKFIAKHGKMTIQTARLKFGSGI